LIWVENFGATTNQLVHRDTDMNIQAIRFRCSAGSVEPENIFLTIRSEEDLVALREEEKCAAFIIRNSDLVQLLGFVDIVLDRGTKHRAKQLPAVMLGYDKVPAIRGNYRNSGQMARSVINLVEHALESGKPNVYLVGAGDGVFQDLSNKIASGKYARKTEVSSPPESSVSEAQTHLGYRKASLDLLSLMKVSEVPDLLNERYLGDSVEVQLLKQFVILSARSDTPVMILGETGTGKEIVARTIHDLSRRQNRKFVVINCGAIPHELFESELFGHEKGSFTGAISRKQGLWKIADGGTLFLDEIGDLMPAHQVKILRALQSGFISPVGATFHIHVNARIIAATNRDLLQMVAKGQFREDLYYRLRSILIHTPALRDHPEDIPVMAQAFWKDICSNDNATLPAPVTEALKKYPWPGNGRELKMLLRQINSVFGYRKVTPKHLESLERLETYRLIARSKGRGKRGVDALNVKWLLHLRRVEDIIKSIELTVRPVVSGLVDSRKEIAWITLIVQSYLADLELLNTQATQLKKKELQANIAKLSHVLRAFLRIMEDDPEKSAGYWQGTVRGDIEGVRSSVTPELAVLGDT
jgi:DNA-binding NtrC family response regulator